VGPALASLHHIDRRWSAEFGSPDHPASRGRADGVVLRCLLGMAFA
jgi:hypothetical protein